jgi:hypothetical protein
VQLLSGGLKSPESVEFAPDGRLLAAGGFGIQVWDTRDGSLVLTDCARTAYFGWDIAFTDDGRRLLLANGQLGWVAIDPQTGTIKTLANFGKASPLAMSHEGGWVVLATVVYPVTAAGPWRSVKLHAYRLTADVPERLWASETTAALINRLRVIPGTDTFVCLEFRAFSAEGPTNKLTLTVRSRANGRILAEALVPAEGTEAMAVHPSGRWAAACTGSGILVWNLGDISQRPRRFGNPSRKYVRCLAFSPDGHLLAAGSNDGLVTFWEPATGKRVRSFDWSIGQVTAVGFARDGLRCAAAGKTGHVVVWDVDG